MLLGHTSNRHVAYPNSIVDGKIFRLSNPVKVRAEIFDTYIDP